MGIMTVENLYPTKLCWLFPNLILILHPEFVVSVILQPTSMGECILRTSLFNRNSNTDSETASLPNEWQDYMRMICDNAQTMQSKTDKLTAPGSPELTVDMIPVENNFAAYAFHQYIFKKIETNHEYYWNAPLYSNNIRR